MNQDEVKRSVLKYGSYLREARKKANLTQIEAAQRLEIAVNSLRLYEADKRLPSIAVLIKMADVYGESFAFFSTSSEPELSSPSKDRLITAFDQLNPTGQSVALERVEELTKIPDYQKAENPADDT